MVLNSLNQLSPTISVFDLSLSSDDLTKSNTGSSSDSEKKIQRLNDELQEAQELAKNEKHKCTELQGLKKKINVLFYLWFDFFFFARK